MAEQRDLKLGHLIEGEQFRDAIHIAVAPVTAKEKLYPGQRAGLVSGSNCEVAAARHGNGQGIIDPFLDGAVFPGERCWLFLYPQTVTGMRHEWQHPAFADTPVAAAPAVPAADKPASEQWMRDFAAQHFSHLSEHYDGTGRLYTAEELIEFGKDFLLGNGRHVQQGSESLRDYANTAEFWQHFEVITGMMVPEYQRHNSPFCCTC